MATGNVEKYGKIRNGHRTSDIGGVEQPTALTRRATFQDMGGLSAVVMILAWIAVVLACLYYGQVLGNQRVIGAWGGLLLAFFLGPIGLLVILLFPKTQPAQS